MISRHDHRIPAKAIIAIIIILSNFIIFPSSKVYAQDNSLKFSDGEKLFAIFYCLGKIGGGEIRRWMRPGKLTASIISDIAKEEGINEGHACAEQLRLIFDQVEQRDFQDDIIEVCYSETGNDLKNYTGRDFCKTREIEDWRAYKEALARGNSEEKVTKPEVFEALPIPELKSAAFAECQQRAASVSAGALRQCILDETGRFDQRLNEAYGCLKRGLSSTQFSALQNAQRRWIADRDAKCAFENEQGTLRNDLKAGCRLDETKTKSQELVSRARSLGIDCSITDLDRIQAPPIDIAWQASPGTAFVTDGRGGKLTVDCSKPIQYGVTVTSEGDGIPQPSVGGFLSVEVFGRAGNRISTISVRTSATKKYAKFQMARSAAGAIKKGHIVSLEGSDGTISFSLSGSAKALEICETSIRDSEPAGSSSSNGPAISALWTQYAPGIVSDKLVILETKLNGRFQMQFGVSANRVNPLAAFSPVAIITGTYQVNEAQLRILVEESNIQIRPRFDFKILEDGNLLAEEGSIFQRKR